MTMLKVCKFNLLGSSSEKPHQSYSRLDECRRRASFGLNNNLFRHYCLFVVGIIFTVAGLLMLDFCCDACQTPCRTLMIDCIPNEEQARGLSMFTVVAGIGGSLGYTIGGESLISDVLS